MSFEIDIICSCFFGILVCSCECRSHCCSWRVGLEPMAFAIQPKLGIVCLYVLRQFFRFVLGQVITVREGVVDNVPPQESGGREAICKVVTKFLLMVAIANYLVGSIL